MRFGYVCVSLCVYVCACMYDVCVGKAAKSCVTVRSRVDTAILCSMKGVRMHETVLGCGLVTCVSLYVCM